MSSVGAFGSDWHALLDALDESGADAQLALDALESREAVRARKLMSRGARLGALAIAKALDDAGWSGQLEDIGAFFGVGASGGSLEDLEAILAKSAGPRGFSLEAFGGAGLLACNPLLAFQLMNNFTLCHGAILAGTAGPNAAFFARGSGTAFALAEAIHALAEGDATRVLAGGADTALHPVTRDELARDAWLARGLKPAEGAAVLALCPVKDGLTRIGDVCVGEWADELAVRPDDLLVTTGCTTELRRRFAGYERHLDASALGDSLAATPALCWVLGHLLISAGRATSVLAVTGGIDGCLTVARLEAPP